MICYVIGEGNLALIAVQVIVALIGAIKIGEVAYKHKLDIVKILGAGLGAGLAIYLVIGGVFVFTGKIDQELHSHVVSTSTGVTGTATPGC